MATRYALTYLRESRRWRKRYKGRQYYFSANGDETKEQSYRRCLAEWESKKVEIDQQERANNPSVGAWLQVLEIAKHYRDQCEGCGNRSGWQQMNEWVLLTQTAIETQQPFRGLEGLSPPALAPMPPEEEVLGKSPWELPPRDPDKTIGGLVTRYLGYKLGKITAGRYASLKPCLTHFQEWAGVASGIEAVDGARLLDYHEWLLTQVQRKKWSSYYARDHWVALKGFLKWCYEAEIIEQLPRNFGSLKIQTENGNIETVPVAEIRQLLDGASEVTRMYLLLMLNTGMQQQDIADLEQGEVDWLLGRIRRKRSKTDNHETVPEVDYPLWQETFALLKKYRSTDKIRVLLNEDGKPLKVEEIVAGKLKKTDNIKSAYFRLTQRLKVENPKPLKLLRKTSATLLAEHADDALAQYFLGHAPQTVAGKHYIRPSATKFDEAVKWLGEQYQGRG